MKVKLYVLVIIGFILLFSGCVSSLPKIHEASLSGDLNAVKQELKKGIDVNEEFPQNKVTPLMIASGRGNMKVVKFLIQNGANIDLQSKTGGTALIEATATNQVETVKYLLSKGAKKHHRIVNDSSVIKSFKNKTALEIAQMNGNGEIIMILKGNDDVESKRIKKKNWKTLQKNRI